MSATATIEGVSLSSPERVLFPDQGLTKQELARYFARVAQVMLPHVAGRPLALVRCPRGRSKPCFFQKHPQGSEPAPVRSASVPEGDGRGTHLCIQDAAGLVALAQIGVLEVHVWGARARRPERPDRLVFDLDPGPGVGFGEVKRAAREVADRLRDDGLTPFVMTTGGKGLHVVSPLSTAHGFDRLRRYAGEVARWFAKEQPDRYVDKAAKSARAGLIFLDYLRNGLGATAIAPDSLRARPGAPVAVPLRWDELGKLRSGADYDVRRVLRRLSAVRRDPWRGYAEAAAALPPAPSTS